MKCIWQRKKKTWGEGADDTQKNVQAIIANIGEKLCQEKLIINLYWLEVNAIDQT